MPYRTELAELISAIDRGDAARVEAIVRRRPELARAEVAAEHPHTQPLLHRAIPGDGDGLTEAHLVMVRCLLEAGAEADASGWGANNGRCTPITMAAWGGHAPMIRLLVSRGADPEGSAEQQARGHRPIDTAAEHGHTEAVEALIEAGASFSLEHLLRAGVQARLERVLQADPSAASRTLDGGATPLHLALTTGAGGALVELLLEYGAEVDARDALGRTALHAAIEHGEHDAVRLLLGRGAAVDLFAAAGLGDTDRMAALLGRDSSQAQAAHADGVTPLFYAAWVGDRDAARLLLDAGTAVSPRAKRWWACLTPLHLALQQRHRDVTALLLERGADVDAFVAERGSYWPTPLHVAARWGSLEDVARLLDHGADLNGGAAVPDSMDAGCLAWAVLAGNRELVELMVERGLDLSHKRHREALHLAAERGHVSLLRLLIEKGADPAAVDACGQTALERARASGKSEAAALLEAAGRG